MTQIIIDASMRSKLMNFSKPIELVDEAGKVVGMFTPNLGREPQVSVEELDRRDEDAESYSTAEVIAHLEKL